MAMYAMLIAHSLNSFRGMADRVQSDSDGEKGGGRELCVGPVVYRVGLRTWRRIPSNMDC